MTEWFGVNYPFNGGTQKVLSKQIGTKLIKNDIMQLFYTNPGERVYHPTYGVGITRYLFDLNDGVTLTGLESIIRTQIGLYEERVTIEQLTITQDKDNKMLDIYMVCALVQSPSEIFDMKLNLPILEGNQ